MALDMAALRSWIGRSETRVDVAAAVPPRALAATLDRDDPPQQPGEAIPPCWHWLYFLPLTRQSQIGADGHPQRGPGRDQNRCHDHLHHPNLRPGRSGRPA